MGGLINDLKNKNIHKACLNKLPLVVVWTVFGVGLIIFYIKKVRYGNIHVLREELAYVTGILLVGGILYQVLVNFIFTGIKRLEGGANCVQKVSQSLAFVFFFIVAVDWSARVILISKGAYFTWLASEFEFSSQSATSPFFLIRKTIQNCIVPFGIYIYAKRGPKSWLKVLIIIHLFLVILSGQRRQILYIIIASLATYVYVYRGRMTLKKLIVPGILVASFFLVVMPIFQDARISMREKSGYYAQKPLQVPLDFATEELPRSALAYFRFTSDPGNEGPFYEDGFANRLLKYNTVLYSVAEKSKERGLLGVQVAARDLLMAVPQLIYPQKEHLNPAMRVKMHFFGHPYALGGNPNDINSAVFGFTFAMLGYWGLMLVWLVLLIATSTVRLTVLLLDDLGPVISASVFPSVIPIGNGLSTLIVGARNIVIAILIIFILIWAAKAVKRS